MKIHHPSAKFCVGWSEAPRPPTVTEAAALAINGHHGGQKKDGHRTYDSGRQKRGAKCAPFLPHDGQPMGPRQGPVPSPTKKNKDSGGNNNGVTQSFLRLSDFFSYPTFQNILPLRPPMEPPTGTAHRLERYRLRCITAPWRRSRPQDAQCQECQKPHPTPHSAPLASGGSPSH